MYRISLLVAVCAVCACGDDGDSATDASPVIDSSAAQIDGAVGQTDAPVGGADAAVVFDARIGPDASPAALFCSEVETTCTFGGKDRYSDLNDCMTSYAGYCQARQMCVETHLGLAPMDIDFHCPHVAGATPCGSSLCN